MEQKLHRIRHVLCKAEANVSGNVSLYERIVELLTTLFPVWVILGTIIGIYKPSAVTWLETDLFTVGLGFLMLSMGLTLTFKNFRQCMQNPWTVGVGFLAQYLIKPMLGFFISMIGQVSEVLKAQGTQLIVPVVLLHAAAFALGYWFSRLSSFAESTSRMISIECGMQSSALRFLLAQKHFTNPLVAVPSAVSVVCMALGGSALAVFWRNSPCPADNKDGFKE